MAPNKILDFSHLSPAERLQLVEDIWDSLEDDQVPVPDWHREILDQRLKAYRENPEAGASWEEVRERLLKRGG